MGLRPGLPGHGGARLSRDLYKTTGETCDKEVLFPGNFVTTLRGRCIGLRMIPLVVWPFPPTLMRAKLIAPEQWAAENSRRGKQRSCVSIPRTPASAKLHDLNRLYLSTGGPEVVQSRDARKWISGDAVDSSDRR